MDSKTEERKFAYTTLSVGGVMVVLAILLSLTSCGFRYSDPSCPTPNSSVLIGAGIGAVTTAIFFYLIDRPIKSILKKYGESYTGKYHILALLIAFVAIISALAFIISLTYCGFRYSDPSCPTPDAQIWIGAVTGVLTTAIFFFLISRRLNSTLERLGKLYVARTCVLNLMDIFGKEHGKGRIKKSEKNRTYFQEILKNDYLDTFGITTGTIRDIYDMAIGHKEMVDHDHDHTICPSCQNIMKVIKKFNEEEKNLIEENADKLDWINRP